MSYYYAQYDQDVMRRILQWARKYWGWVYGPNFQCAHPWVFMMNDIYRKNLLASEDVDSAFLANYWFTRGLEVPKGRDSLAFRFQQDDGEVGPLRPDGIVHIELLIDYNSVMNSGICLGVGLPSGPTPLNGQFGLHPFAEGMVGDGWFDEGPTQRKLIRYIDVESFRT